MKTVKEFEKEAKKRDYTLFDYELSKKEWLKFEAGTRAFRVEKFTYDFILVKKTYVLRDTDNSEEVLEDSQGCAPGYLTETISVTKI